MRQAAYSFRRVLPSVVCPTGCDPETWAIRRPSPTMAIELHDNFCFQLVNFDTFWWKQTHTLHHVPLAEASERLLFSHGSISPSRPEFPCIEVSRSHWDTPHSAALLWTNVRVTQRLLPDETYNSHVIDFQAPGGIRTYNPASQQMQTHVLDHAVTRFGAVYLLHHSI